MKGDKQKIKRIITVLYKNPEGLWLRRISKESKLPVSTVQYYVNHILSDFVDNIGVKDNKGKYFGLRIIKLKPKIRESIDKKGFELVYNYLKMNNKI